MLVLDDPRWKRLAAAADARRADVLAHPLYRSITTMARLRTFMEHHVWAVWDFMSLLTRLQGELTCTTVPWTPPRWGAEVARFVNEVKLAEESDDVLDVPLSHFELYLLAMRTIRADTRAIDAAVAALRHQPFVDVARLAEAVDAPAGAVRFTRNTMRTAARQPIEAVAAAFALGREQLIPDLFRPLLEAHPECHTLDLYLRRHIDLDGDEHAPAAQRLLVAICGDDEQAWSTAETAVAGAIEARHRLWSDTLAAFQ